VWPGEPSQPFRGRYGLRSYRISGLLNIRFAKAANLCCLQVFPAKAPVTAVAGRSGKFAFQMAGFAFRIFRLSPQGYNASGHAGSATGNRAWATHPLSRWRTCRRIIGGICKVGGKIPGTGKQETIIMEEAVGGGMGILIAVLIMVVMGGIIGWLAGLIVKGSGYGLLGDVIIGIVGANIAGFLLPALGISLGGSMVGSIIASVIGAVILLLVIRLIRRAA